MARVCVYLAGACKHVAVKCDPGSRPLDLKKGLRHKSIHVCMCICVIKAWMLNFSAADRRKYVTYMFVILSISLRVYVYHALSKDDVSAADWPASVCWALSKDLYFGSVHT